MVTTSINAPVEAQWERDKDVVGRAAHDEWYRTTRTRYLGDRANCRAPERLPWVHPDLMPWGDLSDAQRDGIVNAVAGEVRYKRGFAAGWAAAEMARNAGGE